MFNEYSISTTHIGDSQLLLLHHSHQESLPNSLKGRYNLSPSEALGIDRVWCGCSQAAQTWAFLSVCLSVSRRRKAGSSWCWWAMARATSGWKIKKGKTVSGARNCRATPSSGFTWWSCYWSPAPSFLNTAVFAIPMVPNTVRRSIGFVADHLLGSAFAPSANMGPIRNKDLVIFSIFSW